MRAVSVAAQVSLEPVRPVGSKRLLVLAPDAKLVEQMQLGSEAAFTVAFERHGAAILGFCHHMLGSAAEAEDAVQDTFVAAFRDLGRPEQRDLALKPWLYAIARNRCLSILRRRHPQTTLNFDLPTVGLGEQVERRAELRDLLRDLRELPEQQRAALLLSEAGDLSHPEIAIVLGCEVAHVKALVFRARSGLIARRAARETPCAEIREQLANLRGSSLRRRGLRHHLRGCAACRDYREDVRRQRRMLSAALPGAPSHDLKSSVLAAAGFGGGSAGGGLAAGVSAGLSATVGAGTLAKVAAVGVLAVGGVASVRVAVDLADRLRAPSPKGAVHVPAASQQAPSRAGVVAERPPGHGARETGLPVAESGADASPQEQRSGAAPIAGRPDGHRKADEEQQMNTAPFAADGPRGGQARPHGDQAGIPKNASDGGAPRGARPPDGPGQGSSHPSAPGRDAPHPGPPRMGGPPASVVVERTPPERPPAAQTPPETAPIPERPGGTTAGGPAPVAGPAPQPAPHPTAEPGPPERVGTKESRFIQAGGEEDHLPARAALP